jgi:hypothetical protein
MSKDPVPRLANGRYPPGVSGCPEGPWVGHRRRIAAKAAELAGEFGGIEALTDSERALIVEAAKLTLGAATKSAEHRVRYLRLARQLVRDVREGVAERRKQRRSRPTALDGLRPIGDDDGDAEHAA